jgi:hypothetical protein
MGEVVSTASIVESVRLSFFKPQIFCHARVYRIAWTDPDGTEQLKAKTWCGVCDAFRAFGNGLILHAWLPSPEYIRAIPRTLYPPIQNHVATAYILMTNDGLQGRIGICDQWEDRAAGNVGPVGGPFKLLTERYWGESGPGVYPVPVHEMSDDDYQSGKVDSNT